MKFGPLQPSLRQAALMYIAFAALPGMALETVPAAGSAPATLVAEQRISVQSMGAMGQAGRIKIALILLSQEHPEVRSAQAMATSSSFEAESARRARYPRFRLGTGTGTYDGGTTGSSQSYQQITGDIRMSVLDGGVISARIKAAETATQAQEEAVKSVSQKVVLDALTAYLQVARFELKRQIAHKSTQVLDELTRAEQRRVELGAAGQNDLRMAASRRAGVAAKESDYEAQRGEAAAKFESYFRFIPQAESLPTPGVPAGWRIASQDEALVEAQARSTELSEARARLERARRLVEQQEASFYPTLDAVLVKSKDPRGIAPSDPTRASLELNWNFGNGFDQRMRVQAALAEVSNQEAKLEGVKNNLLELTAASWGRTVAGREREKQLMLAVSESAEAFQGRRRMLEFGRETLPNVLDAQVEYYTLLLDLVDSIFDLRITEFRLARATGRLVIASGQSNSWLDSIFNDSARLPVDLSSLSRSGCSPALFQCPGIASVEPGSGIALRGTIELAAR